MQLTRKPQKVVIEDVGTFYFRCPTIGEHDAIVEEQDPEKRALLCLSYFKNEDGSNLIAGIEEVKDIGRDVLMDFFKIALGLNEKKV